MKKNISLIIILTLCSNIFAFEIDNSSKAMWSEFEEAYEMYIGQIKKAINIDEMDAIDEYYSQKANAILQDDIKLVFLQDQFIRDNIVEILSTYIYAIHLSNGSYICNLKINIKVKVDVWQPELRLSGSKMIFKYNNAEYSLDEIVIYNKDKEVIYTSNMVIEPDIIYAGQTGLIKFGMMNMDRKELKNGEIIYFM